MARDHARIQTAIWRDRDFRALPMGAQHLYFTLLSQPTLSYCGVMDWFPNRIAALSQDVDTEYVDAAAKCLESNDYVEVDEQTSELLVRTYIKHDGVMQRVNMGKAVGRAIAKVASLHLLDSIHQELGRLMADHPNLAGWDGLLDISSDDWGAAHDIADQIRRDRA